MPQRHVLAGTRANSELGSTARPLGESVSAPLAYTAFCHDHWPVYRRFSSSIAGSPRRGSDLARIALSVVATHWPVVLGSASPSAAAWNLLSRQCAATRAETSQAHGILERLEADALVLRHKLGLTSQQAGYAMGMPAAEFELLRNRAVRNLS
ncbi:hypothetical protein FHS42_007046 [Streptomyces zagrosensis]|uniref:Uncharacterized protein n=1 Tax=Streptomyces zagrosensis TaxID=1042984 RepID=A0A7W9V243_9ACTN|nr:hypothetical protein [Streptomyces zagrosensis]